MQLLSVSGLLFLGACTSADPTTGTTQVEGQVVETQSRKPVGHATVQVYHASSGGGYTPVGTGYPTDASRKQFNANASTANYLISS